MELYLPHLELGSQHPTITPRKRLKSPVCRQFSFCSHFAVTEVSLKSSIALGLCIGMW